MSEYPAHWPRRFNGCNDKCDTINGPCICGAWHNKDDDWVKEMASQHGWVAKPVDDDVDVKLKRMRDDNLRDIFGYDD